ncbi:hypothetical protein, partial [Acinetobacter baumannii]|uniref:hypothetical protein n=1 Tax=Acinetobacter baumannii TaxID=470 RepID=UPI0018E07C03
VEDANKVSGALGQAARESEGWENVMGNMTQAWTDFKAIVGEPILEVATEALVWLTEAIGDVNAEAMAEALRTAFQTMRDAFDNFMNSPGVVFLFETWPALLETIKQALSDALDSGPVQQFIDGFMSAIESFVDIATGWRDFVTSMLPGVLVVFEDLWQALGPIFDGIGTGLRVIGDIVKVVFENIVLPLLKLV